MRCKVLRQQVNRAGVFFDFRYFPVAEIKDLYNIHHNGIPASLFFVRLHSCNSGSIMIQ